LYVPRKERVIGLANIEDSANMEEQSLSRYVNTSDGELVKATNEENVDFERIHERSLRIYAYFMMAIISAILIMIFHALSHETIFLHLQMYDLASNTMF